MKSIIYSHEVFLLFIHLFPGYYMSHVPIVMSSLTRHPAFSERHGKYTCCEYFVYLGVPPYLFLKPFL